MNDIELPPLSKFDHPEPRTMQWSDLELYAIKSYARAAVEADRAQRVPHQVYLRARALIDAARRDWPSSSVHRARVLDAASALESAMLASTPAPAQQEKCPSCRTGSIYACTCPFPTAQHQEQPQQERGPMLTEDDLIEAFCSTPHSQQFVSVFITGARFAERHHGIRKD